MIYDIRHVTTYTYGGEMTYALCALRLLPRDARGQRVESAELVIDPQPARYEERVCFFGNRVAMATLAKPHRALRVEARSRVRVERPTQGRGGGPDWWWWIQAGWRSGVGSGR